ncbi:MAG: hypothetical protein FJX46_14995 [Alphaproteobacteria bacterium]|nr:hypothetical protein [Alphaproteobacteria bacterium]
MPAGAMRAALLFLALFLALSGREGQAADRLALKCGDLGEDAPFLMAQIEDEFFKDMHPYSEKGDLCVGRADLNGDGEDELLVAFTSGNICTHLSCPVAVYRRQSGTWIWAGGPDVQIVQGRNFYEIYMAGGTHNGWKILSDGTYWYCWMNGTGRRHYYSPTFDPTYKDRVPGTPGYFWSVKRGEPCPDD